MAKATVQYTTKDLRELGLFVEVQGRTDNDKTRQKALEEIQRRMDDPDDTTLNRESFADGLSTEDLIMVEPPTTDSSEDNEPEVIQAVKAIAALASLRGSLEDAYKGAAELRPVIEALFSPEPLTPEQMQQAMDKNFSKTLIKFAEARAAHDKFLPTAEQAWELLAPMLPKDSKNSEPNSEREMNESEAEATSQESKALPKDAKNGKKTATS
jgi:hypothetical protein